MSGTPTEPESPAKRWRDITLIEILVIVVIAVVLYVLLSSEVEYVADGTRELPVRIFVFDVESGEPVRDAEVGIIKALGLYEVENTAEIAKLFTGLPEDLKTMPADKKGQTDEHGLATFQVVFSSGSSNTHPNTRVFPGKCWVFVTCQDFRGGVISLGREPVEYGKVKRSGGFLVPIGIMRDKSTAP